MLNQLRIEVEDGRTAFRPGEKIRGNVLWSLPQPAEQIELRLFWYTRGKGDEDIEVVRRIEYGAPAAEGRSDFEVVLPPAPYSFSGKFVSLIWALELVALPSAEACRQEVVMSPSGREIELYANQQTA